MADALPLFAVALIGSTLGCGRSAPAPSAAPASDGVRAPLVIDSHVHLDFWDVADQLAAAGVGAAVDLAAPIERLDDAWPLTVIGSGPMITAPGGYPADQWAPPTYGIECADAACAERAVATLVAAGAGVVKLPFADDGIDPAVGAAAVTAAHAAGLPVACHALGDRDAAAAAAAGCDLLAHTPVEPLADATVEAWRGRTVISTLMAFGGSDDAIDNLRRLRAAGVRVLYGTDLGNRRVAGIDGDEIALLQRAGLDGAAILAAMTSEPATFWKLEVDPGSYLVLDADPDADPSTIARPQAIYVHGKPID